MTVYFKPRFLEDFKQLPPEVRPIIRNICEDIFPRLRTLHEFKDYPLKPISGFPHYYRIKVGEYRIGFKMTKAGIEFMRVKNRKDIYRHFP